MSKYSKITEKELDRVIELDEGRRLIEAKWEENKRLNREYCEKRRNKYNSFKEQVVNERGTFKVIRCVVCGAKRTKDVLGTDGSVLTLCEDHFEALEDIRRKIEKG